MDGDEAAFKVPVPPEIMHKKQLQMDDSDLNFSHSQTVTLDTLPAEILLLIASFLESKFIKEVLSKVCITFKEVFCDVNAWKVRLKRRWPKPYPPISVGKEFLWVDACIERELEAKHWSNQNHYFQYFNKHDKIYASVDAVHLLSKNSEASSSQLVAVGSRDRTLNLFNIDRLGLPQNEGDVLAYSKTDAHKGWIWSIASKDAILVSASWDCYLSLWDISNGLSAIRKVKLGSALLSVAYLSDIVYVSSFNKSIYGVDVRSPDNNVIKLKHHGNAVLKLVADETYVISASEDKTVAIYDRRASKVMKTIPISGKFPMSLSYRHNQLFFGDSVGKLHLVDATDGDFDYIEELDVGHSGKLTSIVHNYGCTITCSMDGTIHVNEPSLYPGRIATLGGQNSEVAQIDYLNGILVSAFSDSSIGIWKPKF